MDEFCQIARLGQLYRLQKAAVGVGDVVGDVLSVPGKAVKVIDAAARAAGKETSKQLGKGIAGRTVGTAVRFSPYLAAGYAAHRAGVGEYLKGKQDIFRAHQYATQPYYDPETQRYL